MGRSDGPPAKRQVHVLLRADPEGLPEDATGHSQTPKDSQAEGEWVARGKNVPLVLDLIYKRNSFRFESVPDNVLLVDYFPLLTAHIIILTSMLIMYHHIRTHAATRSSGKRCSTTNTPEQRP